MRAHRSLQLRFAGLFVVALFAVVICGAPSVAADAPGVAWTHRLGQASENDQVVGLAVDAEGAAYVVGWTTGRLDGSERADVEPPYDWTFVRKLDPDGDVVWTEHFEGNRVKDIAIGPQGSIFVGGFFGRDGWLRRYGADGELDWRRAITAEGDRTFSVLDVAVDDDGRATVMGATESRLGDEQDGPYPGLARNAFVRQYDPDGEVAWTDHFGTAAWDYPSAVAVDGAGDIFVVGATEGRLGRKHRGGDDAFVRKYDRDGDVVWTRQFGTRGSDHAADVAVDAEGRIVVVGSTEGKLARKRKGEDDAFVRVYDPAGHALWTRQFGTRGSERARSVAVDPKGAIYVVGTEGSGDLDERGVFLRRYEPDGTHAWTARFGAGEYAWASAVAADGNGHVLVAGEVGWASHGSVDAFVRKYSPDAAPTTDDASLASTDASLTISDADSGGQEPAPTCRPGFVDRPKGCIIPG